MPTLAAACCAAHTRTAAVRYSCMYEYRTHSCTSTVGPCEYNMFMGVHVYSYIDTVY
eukprot:COSAG01_NODE_2232_length_8117_cov_4.366426_11_plen_57_part_00